MGDVEIVGTEEHKQGDVPTHAPARVISCIFGLMGFCTALLVGLMSANPGITIMGRAMLVMAICVITGRIIGTVGEICVREFLTQYKEDNPTPQLPEQLQRLYKQRADDAALREQMRTTD